MEQFEFVLFRNGRGVYYPPNYYNPTVNCPIVPLTWKRDQDVITLTPSSGEQLTIWKEAQG